MKRPVQGHRARKWQSRGWKPAVSASNLELLQHDCLLYECPGPVHISFQVFYRNVGKGVWEI